MMAANGNEAVTIDQAARYLGRERYDIPEIYDQLEYIQSNSSYNQYINTGKTVNGNSRVIVEFSYEGNESLKTIFGAWDNSNYRSFISVYRMSDGSFVSFYNNTNKATAYPVSNGVKYTIDANGGNWSFNGSSIASFSNPSFQGSYPLYIFAYNNRGSFANMTSAKLYSMTIYDNSVLVADYVPCRRKSDSVVGVYDLVNKDFKTNSGSGSFIAGPVISPATGPNVGSYPITLKQLFSMVNWIEASRASLPEGYVSLDYIQSSGTQYINSKFNPNQNTRVVVDYQFVEHNTSDWATIFCGRNGQPQLTSPFGVHVSSAGIYRSDYGNSLISFSTADLNRHRIDKNKGSTYLDGTLVASAAPETFQSSYPISFFACTSGTFVELFAKMRLYFAKIYDNDTLIRYFIPVKRVSDNQVGLFDLVNGLFYGNFGSGSFAGGSEMPNNIDNCLVTIDQLKRIPV